MHIIDERELEEYNTGHVAGAINIPLGNIAGNHEQLQEIAKNDLIVVYCRSGGRAETARQKLYTLGFSKVVNGINASSVAQQHNLKLK